MPSIQYSSLPGTVFPLHVAVIADTHVPDRIPRLPDSLIVTLRKMHPDRIFHAGDISIYSTLLELDSIAPTFAVKGNRDLILKQDLPVNRRLLIGNSKVVLTHGQGSLLRYISDKLKYYKTGYDFDRYRRYFDKDFPEADLVIFGHTHTPVDIIIAGRHYFNPGACYPCKSNDFKPRFGWIEFLKSGKIKTRYIYFKA
ncbi:MAG: metallophosphoesterase family protein [Anaerolineaceae bacterium]